MGHHHWIHFMTPSFILFPPFDSRVNFNLHRMPYSPFIQTLIEYLLKSWASYRWSFFRSWSSSDPDLTFSSVGFCISFLLHSKSGIYSLLFVYCCWSCETQVHYVIQSRFSQDSWFSIRISSFDSTPVSLIGDLHPFFISSYSPFLSKWVIYWMVNDRHPPVFSCKLRKMLITYTTSLLKDQEFPVRSRVILTKIGIGYSFPQWNCCMTNVMSCSTDHSSFLIFQYFSFQDKQEDGHLVFLLRHFLSPGQSLDALTPLDSTFLSLDSCFSLSCNLSSSWKRSASLNHSLITTFYLWCQYCLFFSFSSFVSDDLINLLLPMLLTRILSDVLSVAAVFLSVSHTDVYLLHSSWIQVIL